MSKLNQTLETRVRQSLARLDLSKIPAEHIGDGLIKLDFNGIEPNDKSLAMALVRSVPGVRGLEILLPFDRRRRVYESPQVEPFPSS